MADDRAGAPRRAAGAARESRGRSPRDRLILSDIEAPCRCGVFDWERASPQSLLVTVELAIDARRAARADRMAAAVDYGRLVTRIRAHLAGKTFHLIETVAEELAALILREVEVGWVRVRVAKRSLPQVGYAAVEVERSLSLRPRDFRRRPRLRRGAPARSAPSLRAAALPSPTRPRAGAPARSRA